MEHFFLFNVRFSVPSLDSSSMCSPPGRNLFPPLQRRFSSPERLTLAYELSRNVFFYGVLHPHIPTLPPPVVVGLFFFLVLCSLSTFFFVQRRDFPGSSFLTAFSPKFIRGPPRFFSLCSFTWRVAFSFYDGEFFTPFAIDFGRTSFFFPVRWALSFFFLPFGRGVVGSDSPSVCLHFSFVFGGPLFQYARGALPLGSETARLSFPSRMVTP